MSTERARAMRRQMPAGEARLWNLLRREPFDAFHFRRQAPFGPYYADFASHPAKLIIEVDGSQHNDDAAVAYDARRSAFLMSRGYRVLRIASVDVLTNMQGVYVMVAAALRLPTS